MRAAVQRLDAVHKADQVVAVAVRAPLHRRLHTHAIHLRSIRDEASATVLRHTSSKNTTANLPTPECRPVYRRYYHSRCGDSLNNYPC